MPSHLTDDGNGGKLKDFLDAGGSLRMAQGNAAADKLADAGTELMAPPPIVLRKDRVTMLLAKKVQVMQILVWAAFKGA